MWKFAAKSFSGSYQSLQVAYHPFKVSAYPNMLVGLGSRAINGNVHTGKSTGHTALSAPVIQQGQVRVSADLNTPLGSIRHHVEKARVHHRLAQSLQV